MTPAFGEQLEQAWPVDRWRDVPVLVGVSGGRDSTALLLGLAALGKACGAKLAAAHFNHRLRGEDSEGDERFVVDLCRRLDLGCWVGRALKPTTNGLNEKCSEAQARALRYRFFESASHQHGARYVALAHTADDQAETILHRILRGAGLVGVQGMPARRGLNRWVGLVRPMLGISRSTVAAFLAEAGETHREDSSNADLRYTRNRLRRDLIPHLAETYNPQVIDALLRLGEQAADAQRLVEAQAERLGRVASSQVGSEGLSLDCSALGDEPRHVVRELLGQLWRDAGWPRQAMGFAEWDRLAAFAQQVSPVETCNMLPGGVSARRRGSRLVVERVGTPVDSIAAHVEKFDMQWIAP